MKTIQEVEGEILVALTKVKVLKDRIIQSRNQHDVVKKLKSEAKETVKRIRFYRDIIVYLESSPRLEYLEAQKIKLSDKIARVNADILTLKEISKSPTGLSEATKRLKVESNYNVLTNQLEMINFLLN